MKKLYHILPFLLTLFCMACSEKRPLTTGIVRKGDYCYRGQLSDGKYDGYGVLTYKDSTVYSGQWRAGKRQGKGTVTDSAGNRIYGTWKADTLVSGTTADSLGTYSGEFG